MVRTTLVAAAVALSCAIIAFESPLEAWALDSANPYPSMAPLAQYLISDRDTEIALARTAAPTAISGDATILVLGRHGYETAVTGKNGFVCLVEREWTAAFDDPGFWNPKNRSPVCYNPPAVLSILPVTLKRTEQVLAGQSKNQMLAWTTAAYANKELPSLEPGAMAYMMSKEAYLTDSGSHNLAHVMFYVPLGTDWGADVQNSPVYLLQKGPPQPWALFLVPVGKWSDGTEAPLPR